MALPECIRIPLCDDYTRSKLLADGWREVEVLETWHGPAPALKIAESVALFRPVEKDVVPLAELAVRSFKYDRLHADPLVPKEDADDAKRLWVFRAFDDRDMNILAAKVGDELAGFLIWKTVKVKGRNVFRIDLLATAEKFRGKGVATALVSWAVKNARLGFVRAGTQSTNEPARAFYASLGIKVVKRQRTFHR